MKKLFLTFTLTIFFAINLTASIKIIDFEGSSNIIKGERTVLTWEFENAQNVVLEGTNFLFNAKDSLILHPNNDVKYGFTVFSNVDTLKLEWLVCP